MNESLRRDLRLRIDRARRGEFEAAKRLRQEPQDAARSAANKTILTAHRTQLPGEPMRVIARAGSARYLISVGDGLARVLEVGSAPAHLSRPSDVFALVARGGWLAFEGDPAPILEIAVPLAQHSP